MSSVPSSRSRLISILMIVAALVVVAVAWSLGKVNPPASAPIREASPGNATDKTAEAEPSAPVPLPPTPESRAEKRDAELKAQLVGYWFHSESGEHWIENRADGTSRMLLKLDFVASLLYGEQTTMELTWGVKDGMLTNTIVSGAPQPNVDSLVKGFGMTRSYSILEATPERMLLESRDEKKKQDPWTRTAPPPEWAETAPSTDSKQ